jgi:hypothetical protein
MKADLDFDEEYDTIFIKGCDLSELDPKGKLLRARVDVVACAFPDSLAGDNDLVLDNLKGIRDIIIN